MTPPLALLRVDPALSYVVEAGLYGPVRIPLYPASPHGAHLRDLRRAAEMRAHEAAVILGVRAVDVLYLEQGSLTLSGDDWARTFEALRAAGEGRG